jgi:hypothetical protein
LRDGKREEGIGSRFVDSQFSYVSSRILRRKLAWLAGELRIADYGGFKAIYGRHWWHFIGSALREVILPADDYKILVNGELAWDDIGFRAYSQNILRFSGSPDDRMMQSHFYVFLAVGKLLFGRHEHSQAMQFASGMVGAKPLVVNEPPSPKNLHFDF